MYVHSYRICKCEFPSVRVCVCKRVGQGCPCSSVCGSHDSLGWHIHLCLFAKFDFKYLSHHTSWLKQIAGKVLLSVKHVVRRMEALEGTSMFHLVKYMTGSVCATTALFKTGGWYRGKNLLKCILPIEQRWKEVFRYEMPFIVLCVQLQTVCTSYCERHFYCFESKFVLVLWHCNAYNAAMRSNSQASFWRPQCMKNSTIQKMWVKPV